MARKTGLLIVTMVIVVTQLGIGSWSVSIPVVNQDLSRSAGFDADGGSPQQGLSFTGSLVNEMDETDVVTGTTEAGGWWSADHDPTLACAVGEAGYLLKSEGALKVTVRVDVVE
jgi:hypothetical protein